MTCWVWWIRILTLEFLIYISTSIVASFSEIEKTIEGQIWIGNYDINEECSDFEVSLNQQVKMLRYLNTWLCSLEERFRLETETHESLKLLLFPQSFNSDIAECLQWVRYCITESGQLLLSKTMPPYILQS